MREIYNIFGVITKEEKRYFVFKHFIPDLIFFSYENT